MEVRATRNVVGTITADQNKKLDEIDKANKKSPLKKNQEMGREQFLRVLMTQLAHQDPLSPMEDKDFIAQMAQFTSVESMQEMVKGMKELKSEVSLIKASVEAKNEVVDKKDKTDKTDKDKLITKEAEALINAISSLDKKQVEELAKKIKELKGSEAYGG